jgi:acyl-CoA thioesterase
VSTTVHRTVEDPVVAMMTADRASETLGIKLIRHGAGRAMARMKVRPDMVNGHDIAHGGIIFTLADTAFACACNSSGQATVAAAAEIVFVSPARLGEELIAEARMRTAFGKSGIYDVTVRCEKRVIAEFRGRSQEVAKTRRRLKAPAP